MTIFEHKTKLSMMNNTEGNQRLSGRQLTCEVLVQLGHLLLQVGVLAGQASNLVLALLVELVVFLHQLLVAFR
jgi:hypothetical protein